jgi:hypothetical protein
VGQTSVDPGGGGAFGVAAEVVGYDVFIAAVDDHSNSTSGNSTKSQGKASGSPEALLNGSHLIPVQQCSFSRRAYNDHRRLGTRNLFSDRGHVLF